MWTLAVAVGRRLMMLMLRGTGAGDSMMEVGIVEVVVTRLIPHMLHA